MGRPRRGVIVAAVLAVLIAACARGTEAPSPAADPDAIRVGAFNFPESVLLAELYAQALAAEGYPVAPVAELGSRETVAPALEQGLIDLVPEYTGSAVSFLTRDTDAASPDPDRTHAALVAAAADHGMTVAAAAPAQNQNAFAVTADSAARLDLRALSDLAPVADGMVFGGPPECPHRPTCLAGLKKRYGLRFERFMSIGRAAHVAAALAGGEIDVGLLFTTDPAIAANSFVVLDDDRALQPAENVVPVMRQEAVERTGDEVVEVLDSVSAQLTTRELAGLNQQVEVDGVAAAKAADQWLRTHGLKP